MERWFIMSARHAKDDQPEAASMVGVVPTFIKIGDVWCVRHRRDDPLPMNVTIEVLRADGTIALVDIRGRLALAKGSKAKTHTYLVKRTFRGKQMVEEGHYPSHLTIRQLNGTWLGYSDAPPKLTAFEGD